MRSGHREYEPWGFILNKLPGKTPYSVKYSGQSYIPFSHVLEVPSFTLRGD